MDLSLFEYWTYVLVVIANIVLAIVVLRFAPRNTSRTVFVFFILAQVFWINSNYFAFNLDQSYYLWLARLTMFFATFQVFFLFLIFYTFLEDKKVLTKKRLFWFIGVLLVTASLTLSPFLFTGLTVNQSGDLVPQAGPAMAVFILFALNCIFGTVYIFFKKYRFSKDVARRQWQLLGVGLLITFIFILVFNFIIFLFLQDLATLRLGHLYTLPFVLFTSYAMIKSKLFNLKTFGSELMVILLVLIIFIQLINADSVTQFVISSIVLVGTIIVGWLLIKGVMKEIKQRKQLEKLTSELQNANERLKQLDEAKTEFLSITSHQLRTPLSAIKGYLSMLQEGDFGKMTKKQTDIVGILLRNSERLIRLINIFLNISRIESGRLKINKSLNDINRLLDDIIKSLAIEAGTKHIKVEFKESDVPLFQYDNDKIADVLINLIDNAIKYTPIGGWVRVSVKNMDKYILVKVQDNGKGIGYEELDQLFQKFKRGKDINRVDTSGVGLGLYIAKKIIEGHGGNIWAESEGENKGTAFKFTLPLE